MSDIVRKPGHGQPLDMKVTWRDMGDGSHAKVVAVGDGDVSIAAPTSGGWDIFRSIDLDESEEEVKATAGVMGGLFVLNMSASVRYLKVYNAAAANVTVGTTVPAMTIPVPTNGDTNGSGFVVMFGAQGLGFDTGITVAATTGLADDDTGAPGANEIVAHVFYK